VSARGFSLIEATLSIVLVGMMASAALAVVAGARRAEQMAADRARAQLLAEEVLSEIAPLKYKEAGSLTIGIDASESTGNRNTWDDVDDANGCSEAPPKDRTGTVHPGLTGWKRAVKVEWVDALDILGIGVVDSGLKRVTVTVSKGGRVVLKAVLMRSAAREDYQ